MKLHDMRKERDHSASRWWIIVFSCVLKRVHHDGTAVLSGKGVKTVERNCRCWKSACELAVKYTFKTSELLPRSPSSCPLPRILSKITVWNIRFVSSAEISVQQEDPVIEGRRWTLESALPVGLHWTMGLSDLICWSEHPSAVFQKKIAVFTSPPLLWVDSPFPGSTHISFLFLGLERAGLCLLWVGLQPLVFPVRSVVYFKAYNLCHYTIFGILLYHFLVKINAWIACPVFTTNESQKAVIIQSNHPFSKDWAIKLFHLLSSFTFNISN